MSAVAVQPVILCGGSGTRLWPLSRAQFPKQFLSFTGGESLFQQTARRLAALAGEGLDVAGPLVVGGEEHRFLMLDQLAGAGVDPACVLLEPVGRNTAPALALAALATAESADPVLVVSPADHLVQDTPAFIRALREAVRAAADGAIVILGIAPDRPETGYGYIRTEAGEGARAVQAFVEKPDRDTAARYLAEGGYYWNSGMFVLKASVWREALAAFRPDIAQAVEAAWAAREHDGRFLRPGREAFAAVPAESIDYAVMERCPGRFALSMLPLAAGWSDLGSWDSAWQSAEKDAGGNAQVGDALVTDSRGVLVHATSRLVSVVGVRDVVVVETPDAVLVTDRGRSQDVKHMVAELGGRRRGEHAQHRKVHRPWGWYDCIDEGPGFKVKRIMVRPGASLSLQKHAHRAEHWVVVSGEADVTCGDKRLRLTANQSTYIPQGEVHRLGNPGAAPLEIIEVQSGDYLGEDDIVRLDDSYDSAAQVGLRRAYG